MDPGSMRGKEYRVNPSILVPVVLFSFLVLQDKIPAMGGWGRNS